MRGKAGTYREYFDTVRITPAYAGKRQAFHHRCGAAEDHPRLCGEKKNESRVSHCDEGSPPPMRGKDGLQVRVCQRSGITPAYAGKSGLHDVLPVPSEDHPRLCGEKSLIHAFSFSSMGSPPPMRGKVSQPKSMNLLTGITPAYAGKSFVDFDHVIAEDGSPPPMRGKVSRKRIDLYPEGITPAYAGKRTHSGN